MEEGVEQVAENTKPLTEAEMERLKGLNGDDDVDENGDK